METKLAKLLSHKKDREEQTAFWERTHINNVSFQGEKKPNQQHKHQSKKKNTVLAKTDPRLLLYDINNWK